MSQRFFRSSPEVYSQVLAALDAAWGFPKDGFDHVFIPLSYAPQKDGLAYLAIQSADAEMEPAGTMLSQLLASGDVVEVTQGEYHAAAPEI
jgi:hypothetical protein